MPLLNHGQTRELLSAAHLHRDCEECGQRTALDYCRTCDEFYWVHRPGCAMYHDHQGHRLTLVPFVEVRGL